MVDTPLAIQEIPLEEIHADDDFNCRGKIIAIDVVDLVKDIERQGLIQPIVISPYGDERRTETGKKYRLIAGYRRYTAHVVLKRATVPSIVRADMINDTDARILNLSENIQRKSLNILQEARAIEKLKMLGLTETHSAERLGKSRGWVQMRFMLLALPKEIQADVGLELITQTQIRELYSVFNRAGTEACYSAAKEIKQAKARGRTITVNPNLTKPTAKRRRSRSEIFILMEHLQESGIGNGIWTRCLAWTAGEISDIELYVTLEEYAKTKGINYSKPVENHNG